MVNMSSPPSWVITTNLQRPGGPSSNWMVRPDEKKGFSNAGANQDFTQVAFSFMSNNMPPEFGLTSPGLELASMARPSEPRSGLGEMLREIIQALRGPMRNPPPLPGSEQPVADASGASTGDGVTNADASGASTSAGTSADASGASTSPGETNTGGTSAGASGASTSAGTSAGETVVADSNTTTSTFSQETTTGPDGTVTTTTNDNGEITTTTSPGGSTQPSNRFASMFASPEKLAQKTFDSFGVSGNEMNLEQWIAGQKANGLITTPEQEAVATQAFENLNTGNGPLTLSGLTNSLAATQPPFLGLPTTANLNSATTATA